MVPASLALGGFILSPIQHSLHQPAVDIGGGNVSAGKTPVHHLAKF